MQKRRPAVRSAIARSRQEQRLREARENPADVAVRFVCPLCNGPHSRAEHDIAERDRFRRLSPAQLRHLRSELEHEIAVAVRARVGRDELDGFVRVLDAVEARLARLSA